jgi:hypothetical protein
LRQCERSKKFFQKQVRCEDQACICTDGNGDSLARDGSPLPDQLSRQQCLSDGATGIAGGTGKFGNVFTSLCGANNRDGYSGDSAGVGIYSSHTSNFGECIPYTEDRMLFTLRRGEPLATGLSSAVTECVDDKYAVRYFGNTNCTDLIEGAAVDSLIENYRNAELATGRVEVLSRLHRHMAWHSMRGGPHERGMRDTFASQYGPRRCHRLLQSGTVQSRRRWRGRSGRCPGGDARCEELRRDAIRILRLWATHWRDGG